MLQPRGAAKSSTHKTSKSLLFRQTRVSTTARGQLPSPPAAGRRGSGPLGGAALRPRQPPQDEPRGRRGGAAGRLAVLKHGRGLPLGKSSGAGAGGRHVVGGRWRLWQTHPARRPEPRPQRSRQRGAVPPPPARRLPSPLTEPAAAERRLGPAPPFLPAARAGRGRHLCGHVERRAPAGAGASGASAAARPAEESGEPRAPAPRRPRPRPIAARVARAGSPARPRHPAPLRHPARPRRPRGRGRGRDAPALT